jgi:hypothetical protein
MHRHFPTPTGSKRCRLNGDRRDVGFFVRTPCPSAIVDAGGTADGGRSGICERSARALVAFLAISAGFWPRRRPLQNPGIYGSNRLSALFALSAGPSCHASRRRGRARGIRRQQVAATDNRGVRAVRAVSDAASANAFDAHFADLFEVCAVPAVSAEHGRFTNKTREDRLAARQARFTAYTASDHRCRQSEIRGEQRMHEHFEKIDL